MQAYRAPGELPAARELRVSVDSRAEAVLLPLYGVMVPLHITTVRNAVHVAEAEGGGAIIRISLNFGCASQGALWRQALA